MNYSLLERTVERELIPIAGDQRMMVVAWSPLHNGLLTGKYLPENQAAGSTAARLDSEMMKGFAVVDKSGLVTLSLVSESCARSSPSQEKWVFLRPRYQTLRRRASICSGHAPSGLGGTGETQKLGRQYRVQH
jgi:hypothetical protein